MKTQLGQLSSRPQLAVRIFHIYLWLTMILLFVQGTGSLVLDLRPDLKSYIPWLLATVMNGNPPHAVLHIAWGGVGLFVLFSLRSNRIWLHLGVIFPHGLYGLSSPPADSGLTIGASEPVLPLSQEDAP